MEWNGTRSYVSYLLYLTCMCVEEKLYVFARSSASKRPSSLRIGCRTKSKQIDTKQTYSQDSGKSEWFSSNKIAYESKTQHSSEENVRI